MGDRTGAEVLDVRVARIRQFESRRTARRIERGVAQEVGPGVEEVYDSLLATRNFAARRHGVIESMRETSAPPRVVLISPTRNEEKSLLETVAAVEAQTLRPVRWILVDDGSSDRTPELLREVAKRLP